MRVYSLSSIDAAGGLHAMQAEDYSLLRTIGPLAPACHRWVPIPVAASSSVRRGRAKQLMDISSVGGMRTIPALSQRARDALAGALGSRVEWLPLQMVESQYCIMNVLRCIAPLDYSQSILERRFDEAVSDIPVYAFSKPAVADELVFKVSDWHYDVLVTDVFVDIVKQQQLEGFFFSPVWDSDVRPFKCRPATTDIAERKDVYGPGGIMTGFESYWPEQWKTSLRSAT